MLTFIALASVLVQDPFEDPHFGLAPAKIERLTVDQWMTHCEKVYGDGLPEYAIRGSLYTYSELVDARIERLISAKPTDRQADLRALPKALAKYVLAMHEFEVAHAGGGTLYLTTHAFRHANSRMLVRDLLEGTLKDPGPRKVSDGTKALDELAKHVPEAFYRPAATNALAEIRRAYKLTTDSLKNRTRKDSNAVIEFCVSAAKLDLFGATVY